MEPRVIDVAEQAIVAARPKEQGDIGQVIMPLLNRVWEFRRLGGVQTGHNVVVDLSAGPRTSKSSKQAFRSSATFRSCLTVSWRRPRRLASGDSTAIW